jgi:hypothetical protein
MSISPNEGTKKIHLVAYKTQWNILTKRGEKQRIKHRRKSSNQAAEDDELSREQRKKSKELIDRLDYLPLLQALDALRVELLDGDDAGGALGRVERAHVDPALVDPTEAALPEHHLRLEPPRHRPQLRQRELPQPRRLENTSRPRRARRRPRTPVLMPPAAARPCTRARQHESTIGSNQAFLKLNAIKSDRQMNWNNMIGLNH